MTAPTAFVHLLLFLHAEVITLTQAEDRAMKHQPALLEAGYAAAAGEARVEEARAALLPQVIANAGYRRGTGNRNLRVGLVPLYAPNASGGQSHAIFDYLSANLTATQLLYDFGQSTGIWRADRERATAGREDARAILADVILDVRLAFINVRAQKELVAVAKGNVENQWRHLEQVQGFIDAKLRPPIDLAQARADVGTAELRLLMAENDYSLAKVDLRRAMGEASQDDYDVATDEIPPVPDEDASQEQLTRQAIQQRADLSAADRRIRADELALTAARGGYGPKIHLSATVTDVGPLWTPGPFDSRNLRWNYYALLSLSWPLFEGLRTKAVVTEMQATLSQTRARKSLLFLSADVEVDHARRTIAMTKGAIRVADMTVENSRERLKLAEGRYQAGAGTALELADAQLGNVAAAVARVQARFALAGAPSSFTRSAVPAPHPSRHIARSPADRDDGAGGKAAECP